MTKIKCVFLDLSGTLHIEDDPTPGAVEALEKLRQLDVIVRFVTNTSKESSSTLYNRLTKIGFKLEQNEIFSSIKAAAHYIRENDLNPFYIVSDDARKDFPLSNNPEDYDAVAIGLAPDAFNYENMNKAFNLLLKKMPLIAIHEGKYYRRNDGLALGPGPFVRALEYAASTEAIVVGKPSKKFFHSAMPNGIMAEECVMIGDDAIDDVKGAMDNGMKGILVKTGKYLSHVQIEPPPIIIAENFATAVQMLCERNLEL